VSQENFSDAALPKVDSLADKKNQFADQADSENKRSIKAKPDAPLKPIKLENGGLLFSSEKRK